MKKNISDIKISNKIKNTKFGNSGDLPSVLNVYCDNIKNLREHESISVPVALLHVNDSNDNYEVCVTSKNATLIYDLSGNIINEKKSCITIEKRATHM